MENKNTIIALVLMVIVWTGFSYYFGSQGQEAGTSEPAVQTVAPAASKVAAAPSSIQDPFPAADSEASVAPNRQITVDTPLFRATLDTLGGNLSKLSLKKYTLTAGPDADAVVLVQDIPTLQSFGTGALAFNPDLPFEFQGSSDSLAIGDEDTVEVVFRGVTPSGLGIEKRFVFQGNSYKVGASVGVANTGSIAAQGRFGLILANAWDEDQETEQFEFVGPVTLVGEDVDEVDVDDLKEGSRTYGSESLWTGFETKYFISAMVPQIDQGHTVVVEKSGSSVLNRIESADLTIPAGSTEVLQFIGYFGPRSIDILKGVGYQLEKAVDFGFFSPIARPLHYVLNFFNGFVGNYGISIILVTIIIKLLFWPLTQKSYASMKAMQKLQPQMAKIREKFKNDRERLNREIMELYKTHRVNPLGGCLPMLVQIPVFFALYRVLMGTIELRQAPFAFWITDLSVKDPYYITPLIMGATMFIQQKLTPSTMDPTQAKLFMLMPVVFTFMFLNFPAGLVIYWLVNNLLTILQQYLIHRKA